MTAVSLSATARKQWARLEQLREEARGVAVVSEWRCAWWARLSLDDRRTLAVLAGVDDAEVTVGRPWASLSADNRRAISDTARTWARMLAPMRYAY